MRSFEFASVGRIVFGCGQFGRIAELALPLGHKALIVANGNRELASRLERVFVAVGIKSLSFRVTGEPTVDMVDQAVVRAQKEMCDMVVGLGGGSAIDCAKAVAALLGNGGLTLDYLEVVGKGRKISHPAVPWIAVPTTAGTGAEVTKNSVVGYPPRKMKASLRSDLILARIALIDPELGAAVPPAVTARCGMDALCQLIEGYTSNGAQPMTDALALEGIGLAGKSLLPAFTRGDDLDARKNMALAALWSGMVLANAGLGAVHGLAAPLGAAFPIPHGTVCAALLPYVMRANVQAARQEDAAHPVLARYAVVGRALTGTQIADETPAIDAGIAFVHDLCRRMQIPPLRQFALAEKDLAEVTALAQRTSSMRYNPVRLSDDALAGLLRAAL
jgi:alcohol dehydrogenase class IV